MFQVASGVSLTIVVVFLAYLAFIVRSYVKGWPAAPGDVNAFEWHMFVPCRDEEAVIGPTINRLRARFPTAHVWVIDDDSDDRTGEIVRATADVDTHVHLVQRRRPFARTGKGDALNSAYRALELHLPVHADRAAIVVCVIDADGQLAANALELASSATVFGNPKVGAAQTSVHMINRSESEPLQGKGRLANAFARYLVRMQDIEFRTTIAAMQSLRIRTNSVGMGGNGQFTRLSVLDEIARMAGSPWHGALLEDYELGLHVLLAGYENRYMDDTFVEQEGVTDLPRLLTQRTRWAQGNIQCLRYLPQIIRSRNLGSAAVIEAGYYLLLPYVQLLGLILWPTIIYFTIQVTAAQSGGGIVSWLDSSWWFLLLIFVVGVLPFAMWGPVYRKRCEPDTPRWKSVLWGFGLWLYIYNMYVAVGRAFVRVIIGRSSWAKTRRNSEDLTIGVRAKEA